MPNSSLSSYFASFDMAMQIANSARVSASIFHKKKETPNKTQKSNNIYERIYSFLISTRMYK